MRGLFEDHNYALLNIVGNRRLGRCKTVFLLRFCRSATDSGAYLALALRDNPITPI